MQKKWFIGAVSAVAVIALAVGLSTVGVQAQPKKPDATVLSGTLIDLTCASKGMKLMDSSFNAVNNDHKTPKGMKEDCATMCLQGGQPAGVYKDGKIAAVLLGNPSVNLYKWATDSVDIKGWWAGDEDDDVATFVPKQIREQGEEEWTKVKTRAMHE